jgi:hypothetical protein
MTPFLDLILTGYAIFMVTLAFGQTRGGRK